MPSSHLSTRTNRSLLSAALALAGWLGSSPASEVHAQQVLEVANDSLTTYRYTSGTGGQDVRPLVQQRGVNLDGSMRAGSTWGWALAGNAGDPGGGVGQSRLGEVSLATGTYAPFEVDLALPAPGMARWVVGRSYSHTQQSASPAHRDSSGPQGFNWFQTSQPEIVFYDDATSAANDVIYIVYGADRFLEFQRFDATSDEFKGKNGTAGVVQFVATGGEPDTYVYTDQHGVQTYFFGGNTSSGRADYQVWKIVDPAGNTAYVGDASDISDAAANGYNSNKTIAVAYDGFGTDGRRYRYSYSTIGGRSRLIAVVADTKTGGTWASPTGLWYAGMVEYGYYTSDGDAHGKAGDLKTVKITTPLSDLSDASVRTKYYRYYDDTWSNSDGRRGADHMIKMVVGFEGCRNFDWGDGGAEDPKVLDDGFLAASDADLKPYAEAYLEYVSGSDDRVASIFMGGQCGCGGGSGAGTHTLEYSTNGGFSPASGYDTEWYNRVVIAQPDGTYITQYFDECGQALSRVFTDGAPPSSYTDWWATGVERDGSGRVTFVYSPANVLTYTHTTTGALTYDTGDGLITRYERETSGDLTGFVLGSGFQEGTTPTEFTLTSWTVYDTRVLVIGDSGVVRPLIDSRRGYHTATDSDVPNTSANYDETTMTYTWWEPSDDTDVLFLTPKITTHFAPVVNTSKNGSGSSNVISKVYRRKDGTVAFTRTPEGYSTYTQYTNGQLVKSIVDCQTDHATDFAPGDDPENDLDLTESSSGTRLITTYTYDAQGRPNITTMPDGHKSKRYYSQVGDGRLASLAFPPASSSSSIWYGPVSYSVSNHAGRGELSCMLGIDAGGIDISLLGQTDWIIEGTADPLDALDGELEGTTRSFVFNLSTTIHDKPGARVEESRSYFNVPTTGFGSAGTNYDTTTFAYDDMGRRIRTEGPDGTISRTAYDDLGRAWRSYVGTNDNGEAGGDTSGTNNMVKVSETTFDGGGDQGNSYVTARTLFVVDTATDQRVTTFDHDVRGRVIATINPQLPHVLSKYDNLGRMVAQATYKDPTIDASDSPLTLTNDRLGLSQTFYDEAGRVYKTQRHQIDVSDGSDDDHLATLTWYDRSGRVIKVRGEGVHTKTRYDRLGRAVRRFTLAKDDDADYDDVYDGTAKTTLVDGDHVLTEDQTYFQDSTGNALMQVRISRHHNDSSTTGELDTDSDLSLVDASELEGRGQITCMFYDTLDRVTHTVAVGTFGGSDFDRDNGAHANTTPSATNLVSQTVYDDSGRAWKSIDPQGKQTWFEHDDAGRRITVIANRVNDVPSGPTGDDDVHTRFVYSNGHQIKMWVDLDGDGTEDADDQVTEYVYGVTKGASFPDSKIAHGGLLARVIYPPNDSGGTQAAADRDVWFAYNAQGQELWRQDQTELEIQLDYDTAGRLTHRRATTMDTAGDLDTTVRRISYTYTSRGQTEKVTQYDNVSPGSGSATDEVKYTYDDWGSVTQIEQDHDSIVGKSGSTDDYEVQYAYDKHAPSNARGMLRRASQEVLYVSTLEQKVLYEYDTSGSINDSVSRVYVQKIGGTSITAYRYNGEADPLSTDLPVPQLFTTIDSFTSPHSYQHLDRFNRVVRSAWRNTRSGGTIFYDLDLTYDEASNITSTVDHTQIATVSGTAKRKFDALYTIDGLNRVARAQEGNLSSGSISDEFRDEFWTLTQTGNWAVNQVDLNGDGDFADAGELDDTRAHNPINEILTRNTNSAGGDEFTLAYNLRGDLEDEGGTGGYKYVWDAFGRLVKVRRQNDTLLASYRYNGLNQRITWHYDADEDGDTDGSDPVYHFCYDDKWRIVGTWRGADSDPKELFIYHNAGLAGRGGSSYIDSVVLRDRDMNGGGGWTGASDGTLEARHYYAQNWRADVSAIFDNAGDVLEWHKYSAYGIPFLLTPGDYDKNGAVDQDDETLFNANFGTSNPLADLNKDGVLDSADQALFVASFNKTTPGGRWKLSAEDIGNRKGYGGYEHEGFGNDLAVPEIAQVRNRVLHFGLGRWTRRDPLGYVDGKNLNCFVRSQPLVAIDSDGLTAIPAGDAGCEADLAFCMLTDDRVHKMLKRLQNCGPNRRGSSPTISCCPPGGGRVAGYNCMTNSICIDNSDVPIAQRCQLLRHELRHAVDDCDAGGTCSFILTTPPPGSDPTDVELSCELVLCAELRAYNYSGECCARSGWRRKADETYCECVRRGAVGSARLNLACSTVEVQPILDAMNRCSEGCFEWLESPCAVEADNCRSGC